MWIVIDTLSNQKNNMFAFKSLTCNFNDNSVGFLFIQNLKCIVRTSEYIASISFEQNNFISGRPTVNYLQN
jgi:hypothetical protein